MVCCLFFCSHQHYPVWDLSLKCFSPPYMHSLNVCSLLDCCRTAPGGMTGWPRALALHLYRAQAGGLVVVILTQLVPLGQRDPHGSRRIPQNWVRREMHTGKVDWLRLHCLSCLHSASQPQRWAVIMTSPPLWQDLSGALGSLREKTVLKENCSIFKHSSEQVKRVKMGLPRLPGAKQEKKKREVALF